MTACICAKPGLSGCALDTIVPVPAKSFRVTCTGPYMLFASYDSLMSDTFVYFMDLLNILIISRFT